MTTIAFVYRQSTKAGKHPGSLVLRIIHQRKVKKITSAYHIYPDEWDHKKGWLALPCNNSFRKTYLLQVEGMMNQDISLIKKIIKTLELQGNFNVADIVYTYTMYEKRGMLTRFVFELTKELKESGQDRTARAYNTVMNRFISFNNGEDIKLENIDAHLLKRFENNLMNQGKSPNTISFYMRNLRAIYNKGIHENYIKMGENPFRSVYTGIRATKKRALFHDDINILYSFDPVCVNTVEYNKLYEAKQFFFFCFHARGMSFVDMAYLRKENIRKGIIYYYRKKTGKLIEVKVTVEMQDIIDYFMPQVKNSPYLFPIIKNNEKAPRLQYESALRIQNKRLKKLAKLANIRESLTTHVARHSWATIAKQVNLPLWIISEGLGHSDEKTTYTYLASFERSVLDKANEQIHAVVQKKKGKLKSSRK